MKSETSFLFFLLSFLCLNAHSVSTEELDKAKQHRKVLFSETNRCHSENSPNYTTIKNVIAIFSTLKECLNQSGAELPKNMVGYDQALRLASQEIN